MDIFKTTRTLPGHELYEDYRARGYTKGVDVKGAGYLPADVDVTKGIKMPKSTKPKISKVIKLTVPGNVNINKVADKNVTYTAPPKGGNPKSVSLANLPVNVNVAPFGDKGPHNDTFSHNAVRSPNIAPGTNPKVVVGEAKSKMKKEKAKDPVAGISVDAPWTKLTVPGDVAIDVKNQGEEYTAHTGPDYAKNSDYGKQRKVSYGSQTKNFYDHIEQGKFDIIDEKKKMTTGFKGR